MAKTKTNKDSKDRSPAPTFEDKSTRKFTEKSPTFKPVDQIDLLGDTPYSRPARARLSKQVQRTIGNRRVGELVRSGNTTDGDSAIPSSRAEFLDTSGKLDQPIEESPQRTSRQPPTGKPGFSIGLSTILKLLSRFGVIVSGIFTSAPGPVEEWIVEGTEIKYISDQGTLIVTYPDGKQDYFYVDHRGTVYSDHSKSEILGSIGKNNQFQPISPQDEVAYRNYQASGGLASYAEWVVSKPLDLANSTLESDAKASQQPWGHITLSKRHILGRLSIPKKDKNTLFLGSWQEAMVDLGEIQAGLARREGDKFSTTSGRTWGIHNSTIHPISGPNTLNVTSPEYNILVQAQKEGADKAIMTLEYMTKNKEILNYEQYQRTMELIEMIRKLKNDR